jgi:GTP-binding protein
MANQRKGEMKSMSPKGDRMILSYHIPSRGLIGLRNELLTATAGEAIMSHRFIDFEPYKGEIQGRNSGSMISMDNGTAIPYSINNLQDRGTFFVDPGEPIYEGQIVGEHSRPGDLVVNLTKTKKLEQRARIRNRRKGKNISCSKIHFRRSFRIYSSRRIRGGNTKVHQTKENLPKRNGSQALW